MKRIDIYYAGEHYSVGGQQLDVIQREIEEGLREGVHWLDVNDGEGRRRQALLLITPGVPVVIVPVPEETDASPGDQWDPGESIEPYG